MKARRDRLKTRRMMVWKEEETGRREKGSEGLEGGREGKGRRVREIGRKLIEGK